MSGSIPKIIEVEFFGDLAGLVRPGDLISVTGIVQVIFYRHFFVIYKFLLNNTIFLR